MRELNVCEIEEVNGGIFMDVLIDWFWNGVPLPLAEEGMIC